MHCLVGICGRDHVAVHAQRFQEAEQLIDFVHVGFGKYRGIGANEESGFLCNPDPLDGLLEDPFALHRDIMGFLHPVQVNVEKEPVRGSEFGDLLLDEHPVCAQINTLPAFQDPRGQYSDPWIDHRLASTNGDDRRRALIHRLQALVDAEFLPDSAHIFADSAAARAGEIAGMQGFQHEHEREFLCSGQLLPQDVGRNGD